MTGTIIGDIVGSAYKFNSIDTTKFPLFSGSRCFMVETVMTCVVAEVLNNCGSLYDRVSFGDVMETFHRGGSRKEPFTILDYSHLKFKFDTEARAS